jgi:hypothetical protein
MLRERRGQAQCEHEWCWMGKVVDDRWGSAVGEIVGSAQEKRAERRSWAGAAREATDTVASGWQMHGSGVRGSGAKHDAREWAITRQMPGVQAEDGHDGAQTRVQSDRARRRGRQVGPS